MTKSQLIAIRKKLREVVNKQGNRQEEVQYFLDNLDDGLYWELIQTVEEVIKDLDDFLNKTV